MELASVCKVNGCAKSWSATTGAVVRAFLIAWNAASCFACQSQGCAFFNSQKKSSATVAKFGIKRRYQHAEPRKFRSLRIFHAAGKSKIGVSSLGSTLTSSLLLKNSRCLILLRKNRHFSALIERPAAVSRSNTSFKHLRRSRRCRSLL